MSVFSLIQCMSIKKFMKPSWNANKRLRMREMQKRTLSQLKTMQMQMNKETERHQLLEQELKMKQRKMKKRKTLINSTLT